MSGTFQGRVAFASVDETTPSFVSQSGDFASVSKLASVFTLTYQAGAGIDPTECVFLATCRNTSGFAAVTAATDTTVEISTFTAGGAAGDRDFDLAILVKPAN